MPLPPMEWIKIATSGSASPPALSHGCLSGPTFASPTPSLPAANQAFLFGGRSAAGSTSNAIYLLDYSKPNQLPSWSQPEPTTSTIFTSAPQQRSHLLCGWDSSSNFRNQLNIYAGRSEDGLPLNDFWYYDPSNHFWAQPQSFQPSNHPSVYGAVGGTDPTYSPAPPGTSNSLFFLGGSNSSSSNPSLAPTALSLDGQLGSNTNTINVNLSSLASGLTGNPDSNNLANGRWGLSGTIMPGSKLVIFSGCNGDPSQEFKSPPDPSCALSNGGVLKFASGFSPSSVLSERAPPQSSWQPFSYCPAPRIGGTMVPNRNTFDGSYATQVIMIGGRLDSQHWYDQGGSTLGEVAVLDTSSGVWARVLPARRDNATFSQKEGILALALASPVGGTKGVTKDTTDILVYGGIDVATGEASSELWVLRLHGAKLTGNGTAAGVSMSYMPSCAMPTTRNATTTSPTGNISSTAAGASPPTLPLVAPPAHVVFGVVSLVIIMGALTVLRYEEPGKLSVRRRWRTSQLWILLGAWQMLGLSYLLLVFAMVIGLCETRLEDVRLLVKRGLFDGERRYTRLSVLDTLQKSTHAKLGLAIGALGCVVVPGLYLLSWLDGRLEAWRKKREPAAGAPRRLKAKEAHSLGRARRALERTIGLAHRWRRSWDVKRVASGPKEPVQSPHQLESMGEKRAESMVTIEPASAPSTGAMAMEGAMDKAQDISHERLGSTSTTHTQTRLLVQGTPSMAELRCAPAGETPLGSPAGQQMPASSPFLKGLFNLSSVFFETPFGPRPTSGGVQEKVAEERKAEGSTFEVLNRMAGRNGHGQRAHGGSGSGRVVRERMSLDIMSESGSSSHSEGVRAGYCSRSQDGERQDGPVPNSEPLSEEEEEEDDDKDSLDRMTVEARRKLRRLADACLHTTLLVTNIYVVATCLLSSSKTRKWLGGVYGGYCVVCYCVIGYLGWKGRPSVESTLVIFVEIIRNGTGGFKKESEEGQVGKGQFSSYTQQQQQQVQQQLQNLQHSSPLHLSPRPHSLGLQSSIIGTNKWHDGLSGVSGSDHQRMSGYYGSFSQQQRGRGRSFSEFNGGGGMSVWRSDEGHGDPIGIGGFVGVEGEYEEQFDGNDDGVIEGLEGVGFGENGFDGGGGVGGVGGGVGVGGDGRRMRRGNEVGEMYLSEREVQIVTTAPRRKLAVVNG